MTKKDKVTVDDIIGIVHTDETTNSVEEVRKLRGRTNERFTKDFECPNNFISFIYDNEDVLTTGEVVDLLNQLNDENVQLKKDCTVLIYHNQEYRKEKEQLKQKIKSINEILSEDIGYIESLRKIEEALK